VKGLAARHPKARVGAAVTRVECGIGIVAVLGHIDGGVSAQRGRGAQRKCLIQSPVLDRPVAPQPARVGVTGGNSREHAVVGRTCSIEVAPNPARDAAVDANAARVTGSRRDFDKLRIGDVELTENVVAPALDAATGSKTAGERRFRFS